MDVVPCADEVRYPQLKGGIKISHPSQRGPGTLGAIVQDNATGELLGLSAQHVVGDRGGSLPQVVWQPVEPPGVHIQGGGPVSPDDAVGAVVNAEFPRPVPGVVGSLVSDVDAAVFKLDAAPSAQRRTGSPAVVGRASLGANLVESVTAIAEPFPGTIVRKRGFVTGLTQAIVLSNHAWASWTPGGRNALLAEQAFVVGAADNPGDKFCDDGDSGSLVLDSQSPTALGLLWGMEISKKTGRRGKWAYFSKMRTIEARLGVTTAWSRP
jgi:hypothetical protein